MGKEQLELAFLGTNDGLWDWDVTNKTVYFSTQWKNMLGWQDHEIGNTIDECRRRIHPDDLPQVNADFKAYIRGKTPLFRTFHRSQHKEGYYLWFLSRGVAVRDERKKICRMVGTCTDITEQKESGHERIDKFFQPPKVTSPTREGSFSKINQEADITINTVLDMLKQLLATSLSTQQRRCLDSIYESVGTLLNLTHGILNFIPVADRQFTLTAINFELSVLFDEIVRMFAPTVERKQIALMYHISAKIPTYLRGDASRLRQILTHLLSNAVKSTFQGEIVLRATFLKESGEKIQLRFEIRDTGVGFEKAVQERLLQTDEESGLELGITKQLVEKMGGEIGFRSNIGQGSVFWFTLELEPASNQPLRRTTLFHRKSILIVESNNTQRQLLRAQMRVWGIDSIVAKSGSIAVEKLKDPSNQAIKIAIASHHLVDMEGFTFAKICQKEIDIRDFHIILLTSFSEKLDEHTLKTVNVVAQLTKPLSMNDLYTTLAKTLTVCTPSETADRACKDARILVVEDSHINRDVFVGMLRRLGYTADEVKNGQQAVDSLETNVYDLVFMDCEMPVLDGYDATKEIRRREQAKNKPRTPIIALTAHALQEHLQQSLMAGMDDFLTKPLRLQTLRETLAHWLVSSPSQECPPSQPSPPPHPSVETTPSIDRRALASLKEIMGTEATMLLVNQFIAYAVQQIAALRQCVTQNDSDTLRRKAHQLKGESMQIGALHLGTLCKELETVAKQNSLSDAIYYLTQIESEIQRVDTALTQIIAGTRE